MNQNNITILVTILEPLENMIGNFTSECCALRWIFWNWTDWSRFQVAELKQELKLRGLTVSGTKNDLLERLKNYQEQNNGSSAAGAAAAALKTVPAQLPQVSVQLSSAAPHQNPKDAAAPVSAFSIAATTRVHSTTPPQIMRFSSTSSSPPVSPTPSDRSLAGLSPDETSCNGDVFGEMVGLCVWRCTAEMVKRKLGMQNISVPFLKFIGIFQCCIYSVHARFPYFHLD